MHLQLLQTEADAIVNELTRIPDFFGVSRPLLLWCVVCNKNRALLFQKSRICVCVQYTKEEERKRGRFLLLVLLISGCNWFVKCR